MANIVKHGTFTAEAAEKEEQEIQTSGAFLKLGVGKTTIRVLPPPAGQNLPWVKTQEHFIKTPGAQRAAIFACPRVLAKQPCPACAIADKLNSSGNPVDRDRAWEYRPKMRAYMNVIARKEPEKGVQVLAVGKTILEKMIKIRKDEDAGGDFTDVVNGFDLIIDRTGTGKNDTEYEVMASRKITPLGDDSWLDQAHDLTRHTKVRTAAEIQAELSGEEENVAASGARDVGRGSTGGGQQRRRTAQDDIEDPVDAT